MNPSGPVHVAVVVVCYNGRERLGDCLDSLFAGGDAGVEQTVIVVDNASTDGSARFVREGYPQALLVESDVNRGYGGGANLGWGYVRQDLPSVEFLCVLNQDVIVEPGWLRPLADFMSSHPRAGIAQST